MNRKFLTSIILIFSILVFGFSTSIITIFADSVYNGSETKYLYDADEIKEVLKTIEGDNALKASSDTEASSKLNINEQDASPYKLYTVSPDDFAHLSDEKDKVSKVTDGKYKWVIPDGERVIKVGLDGDKWKMLGYSTSSDNQEQAEIVQSQSVKAILSEKQNSVESKVVSENDLTTEYVCFEVPQYHTYFVGAFSKNNYYVIPFGNRPDLTGLENGKQYSIEKANEILTAHFKENDSITAKGNGGGYNQNQNNNTVWIVLSVIIVLISFVLIVFSRKKGNIKKN